MVEINKFPNTTERERVATLKKYDRLYENEQKAVLGLHKWIEKQFSDQSDILYIAHAIPARISEFYGDFVQGDVSQMVIESANEKDSEFVNEIIDGNDLKEKIYDYGVDQSEFGFLVLLGRVEDDNFIIDTVPQDQYFPQPDGSVVFATYKRNPDVVFNDQYYLYTQHYKKESGNVVIERQAFETGINGIAIKKIDLSVIAKLLGKDEIKDKETLDIDVLPIVQIDNGRRSKYGFGKSDYADIMPQLAEINERLSQNATQFLKNINAKMLLPDLGEKIVDEDGKIKTGIDAYLVPLENHNVEARYIVNDNPLISDAREHIIFQLKMISWLSGVPMFELLKTGMPEQVESMRIQLFNAIRKTDTKRAKLMKGIKDILWVGSKLLNKEFEENVIIKFGDVLPIDERVETEIEETKTRAGLSSRRSAIKRLEGYDDEKVDNEMVEISKEEKVAGIDIDKPPTL